MKTRAIGSNNQPDQTIGLNNDAPPDSGNAAGDALLAVHLPGNQAAPATYHEQNSGDTSSLPGLQISQAENNQAQIRASASDNSESPRNILIHGKNGNTDTISGISPRAGETLTQLIKRLHPDLDEKQIAHEIAQLRKYNRDYGNGKAIPDDPNQPLDPNRTIYLTSVKYYDSSGHLTRIDSPTGSVRAFQYSQDGQLSSYIVTGPDGHTIEEAAQKNFDGTWLVQHNGKTDQLPTVELDGLGNLLMTDSQGNQLTHLTNGTDIQTIYQDRKPVQAVSMRADQVIEYLFEGDEVKIVGTQADDPDKKVILSTQPSPETLERLAIARGKMRVQARQMRAGYDMDSSNGQFNGDSITPPSNAASAIVQAIKSLEHVSVQDIGSGVNPNVGCAVMVGEALARAGFGSEFKKITRVDVLEDKLKQLGFTKVPESQLQQGDVIIALGDGDSGHTAISVGNNMEMGNSSSAGYVREDDYQSVFGRFKYRVGYRYVGA